MAFSDALIDHADVRVGDACPVVRLHQASALYGVASTLLGGGRVQERSLVSARRTQLWVRCRSRTLEFVVLARVMVSRLGAQSLR